MEEEEERPDAFVHGLLSRAKLIGVTGCAPIFGVTSYTWQILYG
jgi:hypothetical protein